MTQIGSIVKLRSYPDENGQQIQRLAVVTGLLDGAVRLVLASPHVEFATDLDVFVGRGDSGLPYDLIFQGELYGIVSDDQVVEVLASVEPALAEAVGRAVETDGESLDPYTVGFPLQGPDDGRRIYKDLELKELDGFTRKTQLEKEITNGGL
jgi:hypothetical protein